MFAPSKLLALVAAVLFRSGLSAANAQEKVWKHGILEAKSDAGFIAMVDKGGFGAKHGLKIELLQIKAGATLMKALIAGEIDSVDMGAAAASSSSAAPGPACRRSCWPRPRSTRWRTSRERMSPFPLPARCPICCFAECWMP